MRIRAEMLTEHGLSAPYPTSPFTTSEIRDLIRRRHLSFSEALEVVRSSSLFTTHTPVPAGHDAFPESMMRQYMAHYPDTLDITWDQFINLGKTNPNDPNERFSMSVLASNIANAATPGYKARDFDFQKALAAASGANTGTAASAAAADRWMGYRVPLQPSLDGNTVELSTEQTLFAENALQYKTTLSFLQGRVSTVMSALKGE